MVADNDVVESTEENQTAGSQEPSIPKYRFDEISARLRRAEEEVSIKDQLLQNLSESQRPRQAEEPGLSADDYGIDSATFEAARKIAQSEIAKVTKTYQSQMGLLANSVEEAHFIANKGRESSPYLDKMKSYRQKHAQLTGIWLDMETCYKCVKFEEGPAKKTTDPIPAAPVVEKETVSHPATGSTHIPGGGAMSDMSGEFGGKTIEEMEAELGEKTF